MKTKLVERQVAEVTVSVEDLLALLRKACVDRKVAAGHEVIGLSVEALDEDGYLLGEVHELLVTLSTRRTT